MVTANTRRYFSPQHEDNQVYTFRDSLARILL